MKKTLIISTILILLTVFSTNSFAISPTKAPTPTTSGLQAQVDELKSKIASKVASLNLVERRGIYGSVTDASDSQITITNMDGENRFVDVDELTKFSSPNSKTFGISDIKKGMYLSILGLYNKDSQRLQARVIYEDSALPNIIYGAIYSLDQDNFSLSVAKENGAKNIVDVESLTKTSGFVSSELVKSGFSKMELAEPIIVIGYPDKKDKNRTVASRIILFPEISASAKINLSTNQPTVIPSTGSGKKLTPIIK